MLLGVGQFCTASILSGFVCVPSSELRVTPFGLANSPSTFERLMEDVLRGLQWEECLLYLDDIIVPGSSVEQSLFRLEHTLPVVRT
jgi:hypothetical protein